MHIEGKYFINLFIWKKLMGHSKKKKVAWAAFYFQVHEWAVKYEASCV